MIRSYYDPPDHLEGSMPMRGDDPRHEAMFSYVTPEARVRAGPSVAADSSDDRCGPGAAVAAVRSAVLDDGPAVDSAGAVVAGLVAADALQHPQRAAAGGGVGLQRLYRWFVGLSLDDPIWDATTFTKNRDRLLDGDIADAFFAEVLAAIKADGLMSDEHFTVDGTLLEAWASHKSFKPKGADRTPPDDPKNPTVNFHGQTRRNDTHAVDDRSRRAPL